MWQTLQIWRFFLKGIIRTPEWVFDWVARIQCRTNFCVIAFQVTIAEILLIIMRTFKVSIWNLDYIINLIIKNLSKSLTENKYSQLDEEQPMEID